MTDQPFPFADVALARRLERAEAHGNARSVEARARLFPESGACWIEVAGAFAMFDGPSSPITQTFGLGMFQTATADDLAAIEAFYRERGAPVFHEVCPLADATLVTQLNERGYRPCEFTSVLYRPIDEHITIRSKEPTQVRVRLIGDGEQEVFAQTAAAGWQEFGFGDFMLEIGRVNAHTTGLRLFLAELKGAPIATGALSLCDGVAHLAGASTIPEGRKRGAQLALLDHRLRYAASHGCDLALMGAQPGSGSQRNAERHGFRIGYTRIKWRLPADPHT
jgi:GNAT superfamily N-acetyltransferase